MARWMGEQRGSLKRTATGWHGKWREYVEKDGAVEWRQTGWRKLCMSATEKRLIAGHGSERVTERYTHGFLDRARALMPSALNSEVVN